MTTDNFCFYLQNRLIQEVNGTVILPPLVFPGQAIRLDPICLPLEEVALIADRKLLTEVDDTCALIVGEPKEILGEPLRPRQIY